MNIEENLLSVAVGGLIGFLSAYGMEALKRQWEIREKEKRVSRLLDLLYEEVEQLAELLDIDLGIVESDDFDFIFEFSSDTETHDGKLKATIDRLQRNRTIYESQATKLLELPGYLPNALVRFYSRLQVNCSKMQDAIANKNIEDLLKIRDQTLDEAETLKHDIKNAKVQ